MSWSLDATPAAPDRSAPVRGGVHIALAMGVMNVATYGFTILAARLLGPLQYGGVAAVMNLLLVVSVVALALQATAARRISADLDHVAQIERGVLRVSWHAAFAVGGALLVLSPVVQQLLRLESLVTAVLVALTAVPLTAMGGQAGVLQGERRWGALGAVYVAAGVPRLVVGVGLLLWRPTELLAVAAVAIGCVAPVVVGVVGAAPRAGTRLRGRPPPRARDPDRVAGQLPGAARLLRPRQPRRRRRPQHAVPPRQRPLRGRADPHQGAALPPAVRRGGRLPRPRLRPGRRPRAGPQPGRDPRAGRGRHAGLLAAARGRPGVRRGRGLRPDLRPALAVRAARHRALGAAAAGVRRDRPAGPPLEPAAVGGPGRDGRRRVPPPTR